MAWNKYLRTAWFWTTFSHRVTSLSRANIYSKMFFVASPIVVDDNFGRKRRHSKSFFNANALVKWKIRHATRKFWTKTLPSSSHIHILNQYTLEFPYPKNPEYVRSHSSNSISFYRTDQLAKMRHHTNKRHIPISLSPRDSSALFHRNTPTHNYDQISTGLVVNREIVEKSGLFVLTAATYLAKNFTTLRQVRVRNSMYKFNKNP